MNVTQLLSTGRDTFGSLKVDFETAINAMYPKISIEIHEPGCHGGDPDLWLIQRGDRWHLSVPGGEYKSERHYHNGGCSILAVESARQKLNLPGCPLFLLQGRIFNGDYGTVRRTFYLFGQNEDQSYFLHKIRPCIGQTADMNRVRSWIWNLKPGEKIAARQGDLAMISKSPAGKLSNSIEIHLGNHVVRAEKIWRTTHKTYVQNPIASHGGHNTVQLHGIYELRLGRAWKASSAD
jgi:hypothetical protein